jgi:two-component system phosphate regulon sensor histidine kinase PhoR
MVGGWRRDPALAARGRTRIALATMLALLALLAAAAIFATGRLYHTAQDRYVNEAFPLRERARDVVLQMLDEETGVRGYLISTDRSSLQPFTAARPVVQADLGALERLSTRRPEIAGDVRALRLSVDALDRYFAAQVALAARGPIGQQLAQRDVLAGKRRFDGFRARATALLTRSDAIVAAARRSQRRTYQSTLALMLALTLAIAAIGIALFIYLPEHLKQLYDRERQARRAAERGDRASRALTHVGDAVVLLDSDEVIRYWNPAAATLVGIPEEAALNRPAGEVLSGLAAIDEALASGSSAVVPLRTGGQEWWLAASESRFEEGRVLVLRDVTAEHRLERARSEFLATASHELRTPLAAVYGAARTLRRPDRPDDPELLARLLVVIEEEAERLAAIVEQILVSAQLDRDEVRLNRGPADVSRLCASVVASARLRAPSTTRIELDVPEGVLADCDPERLRQVLANLLDNAIKYSPGGGEVRLRLRQEERAVQIEVADEGLGIAPAAQERVFEKFYRADPDMLAGVGGSGLGLYISRELIARMDGTISVRSTLGEGSRFVVELPRGGVGD